jgi:hypothetical protein
MCKVKSGANLKTESDVQNLITGIILRQQHPYYEDDIINSVIYYCRGNQVVTKYKLVEMVQETLDIFSQYKKLRCTDGLYTPRKIVAPFASATSK